MWGTTSTDENNFSPTFSFSSVRMLSHAPFPSPHLWFGNWGSWCEGRIFNGSSWKFSMWKFHSGSGSGQAVPTLTGFSNVAFLGKEMRRYVRTNILDNFVNKLNFPGTPTILRHRDFNKKVFVNMHVDDFLLVCKPGAVELVSSNSWRYVDNEGWWTDHAWGWKPSDVSQEENDNETRGYPDAAKCNIHSRTCWIDEGEWKEEKGLPYHATLEAFSADLIVESVDLHSTWQWADQTSNLQ